MSKYYLTTDQLCRLTNSAIAEHAGQPLVYSGPNMKW